MKYFICLLLLITSFGLVADNVVKMQARCYQWGSVAGLNDKVLLKHAENITDVLTEAETQYQMGYAQGLIALRNKYEKISDMKTRAYTYYAEHCLEIN